MLGLGDSDEDGAPADPTAHIVLGIHAHNDSETGVANTLAAVRHGCTHIQGTINGYGERCGNANLVSIIPDLQLKMGYHLVRRRKPGPVDRVEPLCQRVGEPQPGHAPALCGGSAFAHKGGMHVNAVVKHAMSYQHIDPTLVGNETRVLVSELSGKDNIAVKRQEFGLDGLTPRGRAPGLAADQGPGERRLCL